MRIPTHPICVVFAGLSLVSGAWTAERSGKPLAEEAAAKIQAELESIRLNADDLKMRPGWPQLHSFASVQDLFAAPQDVPRTGTSWADAAENAENLTGLFDLAMDRIARRRIPLVPPITPKSPPLPNGCPPDVGAILIQLDAALATAQPFVSKTYESMTPVMRDALLSIAEWPVKGTLGAEQDISSRRIRKKYEALKNFDPDPLYAAARHLLKAVDATVTRQPALNHGTFRWTTPRGTFLVKGSGDDIYPAGSLDGVTVLLDLGGRNTYHTAVADARENQVRIAIDFGSDVSIAPDVNQPGGAGSALLGIGILALPNPAGKKVVRTGPFSQGAAVGGVGALLVAGTGVFEADRHVQGAALFGTAMLLARNGTGSSYLATRTGQGAGLTQGIGFFVHEGSSAAIRGGLVQPDPREPSGAISMCQGVGFGHRAYAGGGVGVATVTGDNVNVEGSYFSQGCGYWHSMGVFRYRGDNGTLQARRYDFGSGVHNAFGHFDLYGSRNRILNWGVGPAFGWDNAVGSALIEGDGNEIQAEWGTGTASIGSRSFSYYKTSNSRLKLPNFGTSDYARNLPSYSVQIVEGEGNRIQGLGDVDQSFPSARFFPKPWGTVRLSGSLVTDLGLTPPVWNALPQEESRRGSYVNLQARLSEASTQKAPLDEVADILDVAAAFSVDKATPREALGRLLALPDEKAALMVEALEPAAVDQLVQLAIALPAHGAVTGEAILKALPLVEPQKKAVLINFLRMFSPALVMPALIGRLSEPEAEANRAAMVRTLGHLVNGDTGEEPGLHAVLKTLQKFLERPKNKAMRAPTRALLEKVRFAEAMGLLAMTTGAVREDRLSFYAAGPDDLTEKIGTRGAESFLTLLLKNPDAARRIETELTAISDSEPYLRGNLTVLFESTGTADFHSAVVVMGQMGHPHDAPVLEAPLEHSAALVREAAAVSLARMGSPGITVLRRVLRSGSVRARNLVLMATTQAITTDAADLIRMGLVDEDPSVRLTAACAVKNLPDVLKSQRKRITTRAKSRITRETDADVRLALSLLE